jgi:hypothetical protein
MAEQRVLRSLQSAAAPPPALNPNRTGIQINWKEGVLSTIKIRHRYIEMATKVCCINLKAVVAQQQKIPLAAKVASTSFLVVPPPI